MSGEWIVLEVLPAGYGDALLLRYGTSTDEFTVLIDAGPPENIPYAALSSRLGRLVQPIDLFVVTHVDIDHVGGANRLLNDPSRAGVVKAVWFNGYRHLEAAADWLGGIDGELLTSAVRRLGIPWNAGFAEPLDAVGGVGGPIIVPDAGPLPRVRLPGGAVAILLSPSPSKLAKLEPKWAKVVRAAGLDPGKGAHREPGRKLVADDWLGATSAPEVTAAGLAAEKTREDTTVANGSSIAFIVEWGPYRLLLGGDAHPGLLTANLRRLAAEDGTDRVRCDAVKLPHHGSRSNVTIGLVGTIACTDWIVSSNGARFDHPDDEAIARIIAAGSGATVHGNYASARMTAVADRFSPSSNDYQLRVPGSADDTCVFRRGPA